MNIRTRFAPSPTGNVHIGNIRVAIYNWLFARHHNGSFLLRIEDTDRFRSTDEAIKALLDSMKWLNLDFDEPIFYQSQQQESHLAIAESLIKKNLAYREDKGRTGEGECIIFRMPKEDIKYHDLIRGSLTKSNENLEDFVIVRSNGTPTFHLANVLDDIEQRITHIIRGDDHIENTYRHIALYKALNEKIPVFAHLPMIINNKGKPYSKRDGDAFVGDFKNNGFLPDAFFNYLALLGWSPGDDREILSKNEMINDFDLDRCQSSPAQMDLKKLIWMNGEYLALIDDKDFSLKATDIILNVYPNISTTYIEKTLPLIRSRIRTFQDIIPISEYLFSDSYEYDKNGVKNKIQQEGIKDLLESLYILLSKQNNFNESFLKNLLNNYVEDSGKKFGSVMVPLRISITGLQGGPDLCSILSILGKDKVLTRIQKTIHQFFN